MFLGNGHAPVADEEQPNPKPIMALTAREANDRMAIARPDRLEWQELARKSPECREKKLGSKSHLHHRDKC